MSRLKDFFFIYPLLLFKRHSLISLMITVLRKVLNACMLTLLTVSVSDYSWEQKEPNIFFSSMQASGVILHCSHSGAYQGIYLGANISFKRRLYPIFLDIGKRYISLQDPFSTFFTVVTFVDHTKVPKKLTNIYAPPPSI